MKLTIGLLLICHGLIHLAGFAKAFGWADLRQLREPISQPLGLLWLLSGLLLVMSASLLLMGREGWRLAGLIALLLSQLVIVTAWQDAKAGTAVNVLLLLAIAVSAVASSGVDLSARYRQDVVQQMSTKARPLSVVTEADLSTLPPLLQTYLRRVGAVGKPRVHSVRTHWNAEMKRTPTSPFMKATVDQYDFFDPPARFFLMRASQYGLPFLASHRYLDGSATMQVRVANLIDVVDASGPEMTQGETVTLLNDLCLLAPSALLDAHASYESMSSSQLRVIFTNAGYTVRAVLSFNEAGDLVNFESDDRFMSADGKRFQSFRWSTPVGDYREFQGRRVPARGQAVWTMPREDYVYGRFELTDVEYNALPIEAAAQAVLLH
jgi:hypothetical protein